MIVPVLTDGVVTLRAHTVGDLEGLVAMGSDPETARWTSVPQPYRREDALAWIDETAPGGWRDGTAFRWAVEAADGDGGRFAGNLDLHPGPPPPGLGFGLAPWARGRGIMARAVRLAREFVTRCRLEESLGQRVTWAVADRHDDRLLSNISVFRLDDRMCPTGGEVGYWAHPDARGRGALGEALELVLAHAFAPRADGGLGRHRLALGAAWSNAASRRVAERAGFSLRGRFRSDGVLGDGRLDDGAWYDLLGGPG